MTDITFCVQKIFFNVAGGSGKADIWRISWRSIKSSRIQTYSTPTSFDSFVFSAVFRGTFIFLHPQYPTEGGGGMKNIRLLSSEQMRSWKIRLQSIFEAQNTIIFPVAYMRDASPSPPPKKKKSRTSSLFLKKERKEEEEAKTIQGHVPWLNIE